MSQLATAGLIEPMRKLMLSRLAQHRFINKNRILGRVLDEKRGYMTTILPLPLPCDCVFTIKPILGHDGPAIEYWSTDTLRNHHILLNAPVIKEFHSQLSTRFDLPKFSYYFAKPGNRQIMMFEDLVRQCTLYYAVVMEYFSEDSFLHWDPFLHKFFYDYDVIPHSKKQ